MHRTLGFCLGATTVSFARLEGTTIISSGVRRHEGNAKSTLANLLAELSPLADERIAITGGKSRHGVTLPNISEPEAIEQAYSVVKSVYKDTQAVVSAGGETVMVYPLTSKGQVATVLTGNKCASGTGEFYLQQVRRMGLDIESAEEMATLDQPYPVAGRCSVFCKSDCTHALNKGVHKGQVIAGLTKMMAQKILELTRQRKLERVLLVGGASHNKSLLHYLKAQGLNITVPPQADCFVATGAALWARDGKGGTYTGQDVFSKVHSAFDRLRPLNDATHLVSFKELARDSARAHDRLILGIDAGSTTTKAVLIREEDNALVASVYLRTNGDPVNASRDCYKSLKGQVPASVKIIGLGVTGSGRQIVGLHGLTRGVINEIVAHATAAVHFDPEVETIFEIGGQDAKYTYLTNKVPSDYAMNEACSAGTGSFLEEAAHESLGVDVECIAERALRGQNPPNFNDQCAAFISSDIKTAAQEGIHADDILAGLVYSVCMNYNNRVKGNRPVGRKVFMQGGVCYNRAVPVAMAALIGKEIIVPPEPGLMGAFGVALEIKQRLRLGLLNEERYDLNSLAERHVSYGRMFTCQGEAESCDRKCQIRMLSIDGKSYPFGGACSKYTGLDHKRSGEARELDLVTRREKLLFDQYAKRKSPGGRPLTVGINKALLVNSLYPLFYHFFTELGFNVILADRVDSAGLDRRAAPYCYPVEISHGHLQTLINMNPDVVFLPHVKGMPGNEGDKIQTTCPFVQAEPYYLRAAFDDLLRDKTVLSPVLNFRNGLEAMEARFVEMGHQLGCSELDSKIAYAHAVIKQKVCMHELQALGQNVLKELEKNPEEIAVVLFGRPYNALTVDGNMGIPHKLAARGVRVLPLDALPLNTAGHECTMYWATGQAIMRAAKLVAGHKQLFGVFISNFSCGPDAFLLSFFRNAMGTKPSLTIELDSHSADAGIDTRIEAFLDVVEGYRNVQRDIEQPTVSARMPEVVIRGGKGAVRTPSGEIIPFTDKRVKVLIPPLDNLPTRFIAAAFRYVGIDAEALPAPDERDLQKGKGYTTCKECLPLILTTGGLLNYLERYPQPDRQIVYFMPTAEGPCRFGQYYVLIRHIVEKLGISNVSMLSLNGDNGYAGMKTSYLLRAWLGILLSDILEDIYSAVLVMAHDREYGLKIYKQASDMLVDSLARDSVTDLEKSISKAVAMLDSIPVKGDLESLAKVSLVGEIYVRRDGFSRRYLVEHLAQHGILTLVAPASEWIYYCDYLVQERLGSTTTAWDREKARLVNWGKRWIDRRVKKAFANCRLYHPHLVDVYKQIDAVKHRINPEFTGETILTTSAALQEIVDAVHGVISIGPFACMPGRICEGMIPFLMANDKLKNTADPGLVKELLAEVDQLPFLALETDGNQFPPLVEAKLDTFILQVKRLHGIMQEKIHGVKREEGPKEEPFAEVASTS